MSEVNIEIYTDVYKNRVAELILNIQNKEFGIPITLKQQPDLNEIPKFYQIGNNKSALRKMFVDRNYRGKEFGIGQKLLNNLIAWAKHKNIIEICLGTTEKFIGAQRFYEKNGFVEVQKQELPKEFPVMDVDVKFYRFSVLN